MRADVPDHPLVGVEFEPEQLAAGLERTKQHPKSQTLPPVQFVFANGVGTRILDEKLALVRVSPGEAIVLVAVVGGDPNDMAVLVEAVPVGENLGLAIENGADYVIGILADAEDDVGQQRPVPVFVLEIGVNVVDLHPDKLRQVPGPVFFRVCKKQESPRLPDRVRQQFRIPSAIQHRVAGQTPRHETAGHLEPRNEQDAVLDPVPLKRIIRLPINAMVGHQDEIAPGLLQRALDFFKRYLRVMREVRVAVAHALVIVPAIVEG